MKIAIVGGRDRIDYAPLERVLLDFVKAGDTIISGGARGVDEFAEKYWKCKGDVISFKPDYKRDGKNAPLVRNSMIVKFSDILFAFPSKNSRGTYDTIRKAKEAGKRVIVFKEG